MTRDRHGLPRPTDNDREQGDIPALDESTVNEYLTDPDASLTTELGEIAVITGSKEGAV